MNDVHGGTRLRVDLRSPRTAQRRRIPRPALYAGVILLVLLLKVGVGGVSPRAQIAVDLGFHWFFGLSWLAFTAVFWKVPARMWGIPAQVVLAVATAWFLGRAVLETYAALT